MVFDLNSSLWQSDNGETFWHDRIIKPIAQIGPHCISTVLAMLTDEMPGYFQERINTQNPVSWSDSIIPFGMKLAYCPTDIRKVGFYMDELVRLDDLFLLCYYTTLDPEVLLSDPNEKGWICGSHVVILHRDQVLDPQFGGQYKAEDHSCWSLHTKRIFRVVPVNHVRGL